MLQSIAKLDKHNSRTENHWFYGTKILHTVWGVHHRAPRGVRGGKKNKKRKTIHSTISLQYKNLNIYHKSIQIFIKIMDSVIASARHLRLQRFG